MDHLNRVHGIKRCELGNKRDKIRSSKLPGQNSSESDTSPDLKKIKQHTLKKFMEIKNYYNPGDLRQRELDQCLVKMICMDMQPFNIVNDPGFKMFCNKIDPRYKLPACTTLKRNMVPELYDSLKLKLQKIIDEVSYVALTTDAWTCTFTTESYLTLTCHFINSDLQSCILETKKIEGSHTAANLANIIEEILQEWKLCDKVICIITDNAANMTAMCNILKKPHIGCFAHTINLVVQDVLEKTECIKELLKTVKNIVAFFKKSSKATDLLKNEQENRNSSKLKLLQDISTRWNSTYYMLKRVIDVGDSLTMAQLHSQEAPEILAREEKEIIVEVIKILAPFEVATQQISGSYVTISLIILIITGIYHTLNDIRQELKTFVGIELHSQILISVNKRLSAYENKLIPKISTIIDPRFKKNGFRSSENSLSAQVDLQKLAQTNISPLESESTTRESSTNNEHSTLASNLAEPEIKKQKVDLFKFLNKKRELNKKIITPSSKAVIAVRQYMEEETIDFKENPLTYWLETNNTILKELALKYLSVPATSVPSERLFSKSGQLLSTRRSRLKPKNVDMVLFINANHVFLNKN
ncbi:unnamed protein product [Psylliodes chrysocephalus]|uniref:HAT C-terminal dimerisation domain-containing protein n=1 Tax=Psylliodes chrysocephalus TaxID=3402493 RepID=A0A9P0CPN1_9CUCU|nr:unnamed protein product [Psylliodes chrysocephala]